MIRYLVVDEVSKETMGVYTDEKVAIKVAKRDKYYYILTERKVNGKLEVRSRSTYEEECFTE